MKFLRKETKNWCLENVKDWYEVPLTAFNDDFTFDEKGIRENVEKLIDLGESGLVTGGFISETWSMKLGDWMRYHEIMADAVNGRIDLWTIILDPGVHQAIERLEFVEKLGFTGAEVINPVVQLKSDNEIFDFYKYMTDNSNLAIFLYRTAVSGKLLSLDLMERLADLETIVGVKQGSGNHGETLKFRKSLREDFIVSDPLEDFWLDDLHHGGQVLWAGLTHVLFGKKRKILEKYTDLARAGKWQEAYSLWESLEPVRNLISKLFYEELFKTGSYATPLNNVKVWWEALGLKAGPMLPPVSTASPDQKEWIKNELAKVGVI